MVSADALRELHRIHKQLTDLRDRLDRGPKQIKARAAHAQAATDKLTQIQAEWKAARMVVDQKQLQLKTSEARMADLRGKLNACSTNREYQALKDQIAADEMAGSVLTDEILEAMEKLDAFRGRIAEAEEVITKAKAEQTKIEQTVRDQSELIVGDIRRLEGELVEAEKALPEDFREPYQRIVKAKGADAMAEVEGESCGGCFQSITPNMMNDLSLSRVVFCRTCGRLLYLPEGRGGR